MSDPASLASAGTERYRAVSLLGRGGMGVVYRAVDQRSESAVALKRLLLPASERQQAQYVELFHQEFRALVQLAHPQIVRVHDFGVDANGPYYAMELLEGSSLHDLSPLPWRTACSLVRDICSAVALVHSRRLVHRDLSPKNVQCVADGRAKLIDFGALAPIGQTQSIVGTPPLVPPEALMQQPLDGRADLYALGATLFYALTGTHAYPARNLGELRDLWRDPLRPPSTRTPAIPPELDALVLSLLSHDPSARPRSAAEVIDRLTAIADLAPDEQLAVSHAYLVTPELVGRTTQLEAVRARIAELLTGRGGALVLEGAPGMGRSRMLDTVVLEAKLSGLLVARGSASDAGAYGVVSRLLHQLAERLPEATWAALPERETLALLGDGAVTADFDAQRRYELQAALIAALRAAASVQPILLAVDDFDRIDEPSQAALASMVGACRRERVLIALTSTTEGAPNGALTLLRELGTVVELTPFSLDDTEALLSSLFSDVPHLHVLAARIHARADGSPRGCMELTEHLKTRGLLRYSAGSWELPAELDEDDLPSSLSSAREIRLQGLSVDARELAEALAIADGSGLDFHAYVELIEHGDIDRVRMALDELLLAQVLRCEGVSYSFEAQAYAVELRDVLNEARGRALCARVADALGRRGSDRLAIARYAYRAADERRTLELLLAELAVGSRWDRCPADYAQILQWAAAAGAGLQRSRRDRLTLLRELMRLGNDLALPDMRTHLAELFEQLRKDSSLDDHAQLDPALEPVARLQRAFEIAQQRHDAAPEHERGLPPLDAIQALIRLIIDTVAVAAQTGDHALLQLVPSLEPFFPLSPAIERLQHLSLPACRCVIAGRYERARELYLQSFAALQSQPGIDDGALLDWSLHATQYAIGCIDGALGSDEALRYAEVLERSPRWQVPAYSVRRIYYLMLGDHERAEHCRRQIELLRLRSPFKPPLEAGAVHQHLFSFSMADDLTGLRRAIPEMEELCAAHPSLAPFIVFARAEQARICGDFDRALELLDGLRIEPGEHPIWPWIAGARVQALLGLSRAQEAHALAVREHAVAEALGLQTIKDHIELPLALAEAQLSDFTSACARLDRIIERRIGWSAHAVLLGWVYAARARVAAWMGDGEGFERYAQLCANEFKKREGHPALVAKYERLIVEARTLGIAVGGELGYALNAGAADHRAAPSTPSPETVAAIRVLAPCATDAERSQRALELLLDASGAERGELYLVRGGGLALAAATGEGLSDDSLRSHLTQMLGPIEIGNTAGQTATHSFPAPTLPDTLPLVVWPVVLSSSRDGGRPIGVAALHFAPEHPVRMPFDVATAVADLLMMDTIVDGR